MCSRVILLFRLVITMEVGLTNTLLAGDPRLVDHIVGEVKSQGIFDQFRKECIADVDTKPAYQNLRTRVEGSVNSFLAKQVWKADLNKNQLRETLRKHIHEAPYLDAGVERIVDQVVNPKVYSVFMPQIEDVVYKFLGIERPKAREKNGSCGLKDLLPKDLDPVSPESDKNSLKDVSLESVDANMDDIDVKNDEKSLSVNEQKLQPTEHIGDDNSDNAQFLSDEKPTDSPNKISSRTASNSNINNSLKSDDKVEEDEEDSPVFEPIDIMNLNESNISNDSHLSGISELTSHRSRSPDFSNDFSRDNLDFSNQDSQLSKVSSDSRLSIVTDFSCSNHASTPLPDTSKDDSMKDRYAKDNFKAIREFETSKYKDKNTSDLDKYKDNSIQESKNVKSNLSSKESSRDATDSAIKDKYESKDKSRDSDSFKSKSSKEKSEPKSYKEKDYKKKQNRDSSLKNEKYSKDKSKDRTESSRLGTEKSRDSFEKSKEAIIKAKEEKVKDSDKKDISSKEVKDLKDIYKEKIRELREKKELTEKEKLNRDNKDNKSSKEFKDRRDSSKDKKDKNDYKVPSSKNSSSSRAETKSAKVDDKSLIKTDSKSSTKNIDLKDNKSESKDKAKRDDRRYSKDSKSKSYSLIKSDSTEKFDKTDVKKLTKTDKDDKSELKKDSQKLVAKKESKTDIVNKDLERNDKADNKKEAKVDSQTKDRKRRDEKKSKSKDEHCSIRKNSSDRRSTDRDGSNGSNGRSSQKSNSSSSTSSGKAVSSSLTKESSNTSNSSSETSDGIEESQLDELKYSPIESISKVYNEFSDRQDQSTSDTEIDDSELNPQKINLGSLELTLPLKKRPLLVDDASSNLGENKIKKPKFAKNIFEAKKLMKVRKRMEKQERLHNEGLQRKLEAEPVKELQPESSLPPPPPKPLNDPDNISTIPDEERVQIVEIPDEDYEQPYPEKQTNLTLQESSFVILDGEPSLRSNAHSTLSEMELSIRQSLTEMISDAKLIETSNVIATIDNSTDTQGTAQTETNHTDSGESQESPSGSEVPVESSSINSETLINMNQTMIEQQSSENAIQEFKEKSKELIQSQEIQNIPLRIKDIAHPDKYIEESQNVKEILKSSTSVSSNKNYTTEHTDSSVKIKNAIKDTVLNLKSECSTANVSKKFKHHHSDIQGSEKQEASNSKSPMELQDDCLYFQTDNEKYLKFSSFLKSYEPDGGAKSLEQMIESLGGQMVSSFSKAMAPPLPKCKHSTSPLSDILINTSNNNNDGHKMLDSLADHDGPNSMKKRKLARVKKQRTNSGPCTPHNLLNGENFVMPLSPESDVSASSEKTPSHPIKDDKSRQRSSQRYSSDDLYKPRPLFSSSSRRSRRSNQA